MWQPQNITEFFIVRHGETDWNLLGQIQGHTNNPLNEKGIAQAQAGQALVTELGNLQIYASDLDRAVHTARIMCQAPREHITPLPQFREREMGMAEGKTLEELDIIYREQPHLMSEDAQGRLRVSHDGESTANMWARMLAGLQQIDKEYNPTQGRVIIFAHSGVVRLCREFLGGGDIAPMAEHCHPYHFTHQGHGKWHWRLV